ncbi:MAG TPA: amylo-alpha-1,6-glucosidase [Verrucomicrobiae bacterium]|nr:amylo-alpha-1,6-glucosidase [Verrucomicrobiae bacterium]
MTPATGGREVRFVGDRVRFELSGNGGEPLPPGWRAFLRTNLGRAKQLRAATIESVARRRPHKEGGWRDVPMQAAGSRWQVELALAEVGYFKAKAFAVDPAGRQHWPSGEDFGLSVHPDQYRSNNTIYCAFTRLFGESRAATLTRDETREKQFKELDQQGYTVIPPSGKLRDLTRQVPHILGTLGCRIIQLLPVNPTPTTYARMGRFGSPYACGDMTAIDPGLVEFDRRTTGVDQFRELASAVHERGGRLFLDLVINHTGWDSPLLDNHPEWYLRTPYGSFASPGAWGVTWEDLVELVPTFQELWEELAEVFLVWCRRGVDGFRCDAGYKVPMPVWRYITARVREEFPDALFLLEGLGGGWVDTQLLLTEGGMQWAYSELFQEYSGAQVSGYLDHALKQSGQTGLLVHYSETHDNNRLAAKGRAWSLLRNRLSALTSVAGGYGFCCGVEWLASEKILVHQIAGLSWGSPENIVPELGRLNHLLAEHPCFFDGAQLARLSPPGSTVYALSRTSADARHRVLVLINTDDQNVQEATLNISDLTANKTPSNEWTDLLGQPAPVARLLGEGKIVFPVGPAGVYCLADPASAGVADRNYTRLRALAAWALQALATCVELEDIGPYDWRELAAFVEEDPERFLGLLSSLSPQATRENPLAALREAAKNPGYPAVVVWEAADSRRVTVAPSRHWLLVRDAVPFRARIEIASPVETHFRESVLAGQFHIACFPPRQDRCDGTLVLERFGATPSVIGGPLQFHSASLALPRPSISELADARVLLTNGRGGMARLCVDLGKITSKYDCALAANLNPEVPVDRHVFVKRVRVWALAKGFLSPLNLENLASFSAGPPAHWQFVVAAGDGKTVTVELEAFMPDQRNVTVLRFRRTEGIEAGSGTATDVRLTVRVDIEDRSFHWETKRNPGAEYHFTANLLPLTPGNGFAFLPAPGRELRVYADAGKFHSQPEWCEGIPHPVEQSRGQEGTGDAFSPGWFELPLAVGAEANLILSAESGAGEKPLGAIESARAKVELGSRHETVEQSLRTSVQAYVARRGTGKTVIAGYPWFLDWGRDTLICARGLLAAGMIEEVRQILLTFARFESNGTLPNSIHGDDASNRDTSDAPLWFGIVCEELAQRESDHGTSLYETVVDPGSGRKLREVLRSIAVGYLRGTPNGIHVDPVSALVWSPAHFTWMDTNHPAGTPREGYPVEIQALWIRLLRQLERLQAPAETEPWNTLARRAEDSLNRHFWLSEAGYFADVLLASSGTAASQATADNALRPNCLFLASLAIITGDRAQQMVQAVRRHLVIPGALRSLAPLPVFPPLPIHAPDGRLLNDPVHPYWGSYQGDEDTRRKPSYHNGTAWTWPFPVYCEALAKAWPKDELAAQTVRSYLSSSLTLLNKACVGHLPEILDGDQPHQPRGCDAQAWGMTELIRVLVRHQG